MGRSEGKGVIVDYKDDFFKLRLIIYSEDRETLLKLFIV